MRLKVGDRYKFTPSINHPWYGTRKPMVAEVMSDGVKDIRVRPIPNTILESNGHSFVIHKPYYDIRRVNT